MGLLTAGTAMLAGFLTGEASLARDNTVVENLGKLFYQIFTPSIIST